MKQNVVARAATTVGILILATAVHGAPGDLDGTFGADGFVWIGGLGEKDQARGVAVQSDGKILVGRDNGRGLSVVRLEADGSLDAGFGSNGVASLEVAGEVLETAAILASGDGAVIVVGTQKGEFVAARFLSDGRVDTSFGAKGLARVSIGESALATAVVQQDDGKIVIGGAGPLSATLVRLDTAGAVDPSFSGGGLAIDGESGTGRYTALSLQPDGKLVAAAAPVSHTMTVLRFTRDGDLDPSFDGDGRAVFEPPVDYTHDGVAAAVAVQNDGKIVVAGYSCADERCDTPGEAVVARLEVDGTLDSTFGVGGRLAFNVSYSTTFIANGALVIEPSGAIVVGGDIWSGDGWEGPYLPFDGFVARLTPEGALDSTFGRAGVTVLDGGNDDSPAWAQTHGIARLPDGRVVVAMTTQPEEPDARIALAGLGVADGHPGRLGFVWSLTGTTEGNHATFYVRRTAGAAGIVSVDYATFGGAALSGVDFTPTAGTLTWADGDVGTREISIPITFDSLAEPEEAFSLRLANPSTGASLAATVGTIMISDLVPPPPPPLQPPKSGGGGTGTVEGLLLALALLASRRRERTAR